MGLGNTRGLGRFKEYLGGFEDSYVVIGGTACDILLSQADLGFRATKDIDLVLLVEQRLTQVGAAVWRMVKDGGYQYGHKSSGETVFYRFTKPTVAGFPAMIELFSTTPGFIEDTTGLTIAPLPLSEEVSSLSAILLDRDYYEFMKTGCRVVDGVNILDETRLIVFKAKAYLDLRARRAAGEHVDSKDISKHFKDAFRLVQLLAPSTRVKLPTPIKQTMEEFCLAARHTPMTPQQMRQIGVAITQEKALETLHQTYNLNQQP